MQAVPLRRIELPRYTTFPISFLMWPHPFHNGTSIVKGIAINVEDNDCQTVYYENRNYENLETKNWNWNS